MHRDALSAVLVLSLASCAHAGDIKLEEQIVGPPWEQGMIYTRSPAGMHLATAGASGSRFAVTLDGVEGPKYDQLLNAATEVDVHRGFDGYVQSQQVKWQGPVAFSPDGSRYAYAARSGADVVVVLDGKEIYKAPYSQVVSAASNMSFTPDGKHLFFFAQTSDTMQSFRLMIDGQPATPSFDQVPYPFFSADGAHWGLLGGQPRKPADTFLIIDGKDAGYTAERPQFTPDGQHVIATKAADGKQSLLVDGKPLLTALSIDKFVVSPTGDIAAIATGSDHKKRLYIGGKPVDGTEDTWGVTFSPDGKHWAVNCVASPQAWVVVDGRKHQAYAGIGDVYFTPDSSKCVYIADSGQKKFVVIDGHEDAGNFNISIKPTFGQTGNHVAYSAGQGIGAMQVTYDGKVVPKSYNVVNLTLSPDGSHFAYYGAVDAMSTQLIVDGEPKGAIPGNGSQILFSPDSKHIAALSALPKQLPAIYLDGQYIPIPRELAYPQLVEFTPDSKHLLLKGNEPGPGGTSVESFYLDGQRVALLGGRGIGWRGGQAPHSWESQPDGTVVFVGQTPVATGYGPMKRIKATPDSAKDVTAWAANAEASRQKEVADAQSAADAKKAAATQAAADAAQKQADAVAARKKAAEDAAAKKAAALEAKRKAKEDAAAAKRAATGK